MRWFIQFNTTPTRICARFVEVVETGRAAAVVVARHLQQEQWQTSWGRFWEVAAARSALVLADGDPAEVAQAGMSMKLLPVTSATLPSGPGRGPMKLIPPIVCRRPSATLLMNCAGNIASAITRKLRLSAGQRRQVKVRVNQPNLAVRTRDTYVFNPSNAPADSTAQRNPPVLRKLAQGQTRSGVCP